MNLLQTTRTYATYDNAVKALAQTCARCGTSLDNVRYLIASDAHGRFAPILVGQQYIGFAVNCNITVVG
jgi:hypothetical protein